MVTCWLAFLPHTKNYLGLNWSFVRSLSVCVRVHSRFHLFCETSATQTRNENVAFPWKCLSTETNMFQKEQLLLYIYTHSYYLSCMSVRLVREEMYLERTHEGFIQPASGFNSRTFMLTANSQSNIIIWACLSSPEDILQVASSCLILSIESKTLLVPYTQTWHWNNVLLTF